MSKPRILIKNKGIGLLPFIVTFCVSSCLINCTFSNSTSSDKNMAAVANEVNAHCPLMIDSLTRLDNAIALPPNIFQYNYTIMSVAGGSLDTSQIKMRLMPNMINFIRTSPQMQYQRDNKWILSYCYKDKSGAYLFTITIDPDKYRQ